VNLAICRCQKGTFKKGQNEEWHLDHEGRGHYYHINGTSISHLAETHGRHHNEKDNPAWLLAE